MSGFQATVGNDGRKKAAVFSHERSGTHFLMNSLAANLGYVAQPWWNFDFTLGLNFHAPQGLGNYFGQVRGKSVLNILKSHHHVGFMSPLLEELADEFNLFYICRDPRDVMRSFHKLVGGLAWDEGPSVQTPGEFMRSAPRGALLRYQKDQAATMLHRWADHVSGWLEAAEALGPERLRVIRYEELDGDFEDTMTGLAAWAGLEAPTTPQRPSRDRNVIGTGQADPTRPALDWSDEDEAFVQDVAGPLLSRMGWEEPAAGPVLVSP